MERICLSNSPLCTGINPCGECARRVFQVVMPQALAASGMLMQGETAKFQRFIDAYAVWWVRLLSDITSTPQTKAPHNLPLAPPVVVKRASPEELRALIQKGLEADGPSPVKAQAEMMGSSAEPMPMAEVELMEAHGVVTGPVDSVPPPAQVPSLASLEAWIEANPPLSAEEKLKADVAAKLVEQATDEEDASVTSKRDLAQKARALRERLGQKHVIENAVQTKE